MRNNCIGTKAISIHAPHVECDSVDYLLGRDGQISIHAPHVECDSS